MRSSRKVRGNRRGAVVSFCLLAALTACAGDSTATSPPPAPDRPTVTSTTEQATTTTTEDPAVALLVDAYLSAFTSLDLARLESLPWEGNRAPDVITSNQAFLRGAGAVFSEATCAHEPTASVCTVISEDGFSSVLGTSTSSVHTIVVTGNQTLRVSLVVDDGLDDFFEWARLNRADLYTADGACNAGTANPPWDECAAALVEAAGEFVNSGAY